MSLSDLNLEDLVSFPRPDFRLSAMLSNDFAELNLRLYGGFFWYYVRTMIFPGRFSGKPLVTKIYYRNTSLKSWQVFCESQKILCLLSVKVLHSYTSPFQTH
jgi:hypothetical protein